MTFALPLSPLLRKALYATSAINLVIGGLFLLGPELGISLWPSPISSVLSRFIGAIIVGNGVGARMVAKSGTWEGARALFFVALVYGVLVLVSVAPQLLFGNQDRTLWGYVVFTAVFIIPLALIVLTYERRHRRQGALGGSAPTPVQGEEARD
jgi:hypothetical protein